MPYQRFEWIDNLKGFVLLFVCFGHLGLPAFCGQYSHEVSIVFGARQMMTLFFISGFLCKEQRMLNPISLLKDKYNKLLKPYIILSLLAMLYMPKIYFFEYEAGFMHDVQVWARTLNISEYCQCYVVNFIGNFIDFVQGNSGYSTYPLWFVYTLFFVNISFCILFVIVQHFQQINRKVLIFIALFGCFIVTLLFDYYRIIPLMGMGKVFHAMIFFLAGYLAKPIVYKLVSYRNGYIIIGLILLCVIFIYSHVYLSPLDKFGVNSYTIGWILVNKLLLPFISIVVLIPLFELLSRSSAFSMISSPLRFLSIHALVLLFSHQYVFNCYRLLLYDYRTTDWFLSFFWPIYSIIYILLVILFSTKFPWILGKEKTTIKELFNV